MGLGPGESEAIGLALALAATIRIDERQGRQAALKRSLKVIGTVGMLLVAKDRAIISAIAPVVDSLKAVGFFIAPALKRDVLRRAGEATRS